MKGEKENNTTNNCFDCFPYCFLTYVLAKLSLSYPKKKNFFETSLGFQNTLEKQAPLHVTNRKYK